MTIFLNLTDHSQLPPEILEEILKTLPHKPSKVVQTQSHHKIKQYEIPSDPIPPFKPLQGPIPHAIYGPPVEIQQTHSLTTSYGTPAVDNYHKYFEHRSDSSEPIPSVTTKDQKTDSDNHGSIWHKMNVKKSKKETPTLTVIETNAFGSKKKSEQFAKDVMKQFLGKSSNYEKQKSVGFELTESDLKKP